MNTHIHTTLGGDIFSPSTIIQTRLDVNRRRPPEPPSPLGIWILVAIGSICASLTTYLLTK